MITDGASASRARAAGPPRAARRSRAAAPCTPTLGILTGNAAYFALSATGLGALLLASYEAVLGDPLVGAAYLVWLGVTAFFGKSAVLAVNRAAPTTAPCGRSRTACCSRWPTRRHWCSSSRSCRSSSIPIARSVAQVAILGVTSVGDRVRRAARVRRARRAPHVGGRASALPEPRPDRRHHARWRPASLQAARVQGGPRDPGEYLLGDGDIVANEGRAHRRADGREHRRPPDPGRLALPLLRGQPRAALRPRAAFGMRLDMPAGHGGALRAGRREARDAWSELAGARARVRPERRSTRGRAREDAGARRRLADVGAAVDERCASPRRQYADLYGPTTGDRVRLADTELFIEIERDFTVLRRGGEVRRRQGHPRRHGPVGARHARRRRRSTSSSPTPSSSTTGASSRATSASATAGSSASARRATPTSWRASTPGMVDRRRAPRSSPARA